MGKSSRRKKDVHKMLRRFGYNADKRVNKYLKKKAPGSGPVRFRITIEDITDYGGEAPKKPWSFKIDSEVRRG